MLSVYPLQENAGRQTPKGASALMEQLREQVLERVQLEAELRKDEPESDIGPFYGLPTKVKHLFENYRGIKSLYGELNGNSFQSLQNVTHCLHHF